MSTKNDNLKNKLHEIIFEADTPAGKQFDIWLLIFIVTSVVVVSLESVSFYQLRYAKLFFTIEWILTIFFSIEYILRLYSVKKPWKYATSFYGIIDLLSTLPLYISTFFPGSHYFMTIRALRLLRVFRILKLGNFLSHGHQIKEAVIASRDKILVFLYFVVIVVIIMGSIMYFIEGSADSGFTSIPRSIYWAVVTLTTVGYGDISPKTDLGQFIAVILMICGYAVIAVPTGIVSVEMSSVKNKLNTYACPSCSLEGHDSDAEYCKHCGSALKDYP